MARRACASPGKTLDGNNERTSRRLAWMPFFFCKIGLWLCGRPVSCARIRKRQEKVSLKPFQRLAERETASRGLLASASAGKIRKTSQWDVFLRKPSPGVFLTPSPTAGGYHLSRLKSPLSACNERRGISTACVVALPARLCQRAAHAFAGRAGWIAENLRRASGSVREPPTRVPYEKPSAGSLFYPPAFAEGD